MQDVVAEMYARYPLIPRREGLHLMGVSMGGAGALYMGLHHRGELASAIVLSAPIFDVDQTMNFLEGEGLGGRFPAEKVFGPPDRERVEADNPYAQLQGQENLNGMRLFLGAGTRDRKGILESTKKLHSHLLGKSVPHDFLVYEGRHRWRDWARIFPVALCLHLRAECKLGADSFYQLVSSQPD
jgi:enterochelin esterase-like enzyme